MLCPSMAHRSAVGRTAWVVGQRRSFSRKVTFLSEEVTLTDRAPHSPLSICLIPTLIFYQVTQCCVPHISDWSTGKGHNTHGGTEGRGEQDSQPLTVSAVPLTQSIAPQQPTTAHSSLLFDSFSLSFPPDGFMSFKVKTFKYWLTFCLYFARLRVSLHLSGLTS